jgi:OmcA/MtrC family decaheme c-type cytochrome
MRSNWKRLSVILLFLAAFAFALSGCSGSDGAPGASASATVGTVSSAKLTFDDLQNTSLGGKILSASTAGDQPVVKFQVVNKATNEGIAGLRTFALHIAQLKPEVSGSPSYWQNYILLSNADYGLVPSADPVSTFNTDGTVKTQGYSVVDEGNGIYTVTFGTKIKSVASVPFDATLPHRIVVGVRSVVVPGVVGKTPGAYAGPINPLTGANIAQFTNINGTNLVYDFVPATGLAYKDAVSGGAYARDIVTIDACNQCHYKLNYGSNNTSGHFGSRTDTKTCVICHTPQLSSALVNDSVGDFTSFMHKIHMGDKLPTTEAPYGIAVNAFVFPMDPGNCTVCHKGANVDNWNTKPAVKTCGSCHTGIVWATGKSTGTGPLNTAYTAIGHIGGGATSNSACKDCHGGASVKTYHKLNDVTANNTTVPDGIAKFTYVLKTVALNASKQPEFTFQILKDGTPVTLNAYAAGAVPITGFTGGPTFRLTFAVPQDGITTPADFNANASSSLTNLWNTTAATNTGTLVLTDAATSTYKATITVATVASAATAATATAVARQAQAALPLVIPTTAKMLTGSMYGTFVQTTVTPAVTLNVKQVSRVANTYTGRRTIVSDAKCNACHDQLGIDPSFHGGARNEAPGCAYCHTPNATATGWSYNQSTFVHAIHGAGKRTVDYTWVAANGYKFYDAGYPGVLKNCEACHLAGTYDFSASASASAVPNLLYSVTATAGSYVTTAPYAKRPLDGTYYAIGDVNPPGTLTTNAAGSMNYIPTAATATYVSPDSPYVSALPYGANFSYFTGTQQTFAAAGTNLVNSPISSACFSCHDTNTAKAHMELNGGSIYRTRVTALASTETCLVCHGGISSTNAFNATAANIKAVHRWW